VTAHSLSFSPLSALRRSLAGDFTTVGFMAAWYMGALPTVPCGGAGLGGAFVLQSFRNLSNRALINIQVGTTGRIEIWGGGLDASTTPGQAMLARSTKEIAPGTYNHIETKVFVDAVTGTVEVRVNGHEFVSYTGNTARQISGAATISQVFAGLTDGSTPPSFVGLWYTDDWAVWNDEATDAQGNAALITDFIGQYGVYTLPPIADSTPEQWSTTSGTDSFEMVNEIPPNDDTDFLFASVSGKKTALEMAPLPVTITDVAFICPTMRSRKSDNGDCDITVGVISGVTESEDTAIDAITTGYQYYTHVWEQDPNSVGDPWNPAALPAMQINRSA
jgi:hypothetical protein